MEMGTILNDHQQPVQDETFRGNVSLSFIRLLPRLSPAFLSGDSASARKSHVICFFSPTVVFTAFDFTAKY